MEIQSYPREKGTYRPFSMNQGLTELSTRKRYVFDREKGTYILYSLLTNQTYGSAAKPVETGDAR